MYVEATWLRLKYVPNSGSLKISVGNPWFLKTFKANKKTFS